MKSSNSNLKTLIIIFLILVTVVGVYFRVAGTFDEMLMFDESIYMVGGIKMTHGSVEDPRLWAYEHPPLGKLLYGVPTLLIQTSYLEVFNLPMNKYVWIYKSHEALANTYVAMRMLPLLFGLLTLLLIFLITRDLWDSYAALWATAIAALFNHLIFFSRIAFLDVVWVFFTLLMLFLYIRYSNSESEGTKLKYLILFLIALVFAFGSKNPFQVPIFAFLFISNFFVEKNVKFKKIFFVSLILVTLLFFSMIYPIMFLKTDKVIEFATSKFESHSIIPTDSQGPDFSFLTKRLTIIPQSLFAVNLAFIISLFVFLSWFLLSFNKFENKSRLLNPLFCLSSLKNFASSNKSLFIVFSFFIIHFLFNFFANLGGNQLQVTLVLLIIMVSGIFLKFSKNSFHYLICVFLIIDIVFIAMAVPFDGGTTNPFLFNHTLKKNDDYNLFGFSSEVLVFLERENKPVISNILNVLIFFDGEKYSVPSSDDANCNKEFFEYLRENDAFLVFKTNPFEESEWFCPIVAEYIDPVPLKYVEDGFWREYGLWKFK